MVDISVLAKLIVPSFKNLPVVVLVASLATAPVVLENPPPGCADPDPETETEDPEPELDGEPVVEYNSDIDKVNIGVYRLTEWWLQS